MSGTRADTIADLAAVVAHVMAGPKDLCVTISVEGDEGRWLQFVDDQLNMASFADAQPDALIAELGQVEIVSFQPRQHLTVTTDARDPQAIAAWIHDYFVRGLGAEAGFRFDSTIEQL